MKSKLLILSILLLIISTVFLIFYIRNYSSYNFFNEQKHYKIKLSKAELTFFRADYEFMKIRNPYTNSIPENARQKELEFAKHIPTRESFGQKNGDILLSQNWISNGPRNVGGRMLSIEFDINNENI